MKAKNNIAAILEWFAKRRPDVPQYRVKALLEQHPAIGMMATASFEAGREWQQANPKKKNGVVDYVI